MTSAPSFRLLPVEPTEAMIDAGTDQLLTVHAGAIYRAMVAAAPVMAEATDEMVEAAIRVWMASPDDGALFSDMRSAINAALAIAAGQLGEKESGE